MIVRAWLPPTFSGIDLEKMISLRYKGKEANESSEMVMKQQEDYKIPGNILDSNGNIVSEHH